MGGGLQGKEETQAGGIHIETSTNSLWGVQFPLQESGGTGNGLLYRGRCADNGVYIAACNPAASKAMRAALLPIPTVVSSVT